MHGSLEQLKQFVDQRLTDVPLNELEIGLLNKFMQNPEENALRIADNLRKSAVRLSKDGNMRAVKIVNKVIPLFDKHEFWSTQPVPRIYDQVTQLNTQIEEKKVSEISAEQINLPEGYEWSVLDMNDPEQTIELYNLLTNHYVEDDGGNFRFDYSVEFLKWALTPPGYKPDWLIGVRGGAKKRLYGFISGIPVHLNCMGKLVTMAEINFLCVHKSLR